MSVLPHGLSFEWEGGDSGGTVGAHYVDVPSDEEDKNDWVTGESGDMESQPEWVELK